MLSSLARSHGVYYADSSEEPRMQRQTRVPGARAGLNVAYLIGAVGQDPELRTTANGKHLLKLSLATPHQRQVGDEWVDVPDWHRLTFWGPQAEYAATYARRGDTLAVRVAIRPSSWIDRDNIKRFEVNLVVEEVLWLNSARGPQPRAPLNPPDAWDDVPPPSADSCDPCPE